MKALTEKIIDEVWQFAADLEDIDLQSKIESLAKKLEKIEETANFEEVGRVMIKHLCKAVSSYHPHHTVITTATTCELVEGCKSVGEIVEYIQD